MTIPADFTVPVSSSFSLYAKWQINTYTIVFNSMGGNSIDSQQLNHGSKVSSPASPEKEGHTFSGWYKDKECTLAYNFDNIVIEAFTLYAKWQINSYTVTFISDGEVYKQETVNYGDAVSKPSNPSKDGFSLSGWFTEEACVNAYDFSIPIKSDLTLYAAWLDGGIYIYFNAMGGTSVDKLMIPHNEKLGDKLPTATKPGHSFEGWYLEDTYQTRVYEDTVFNSSTTIFAKWQINKYTITYDVNGAQEGINPDTVEYGTVIDLSEKTPTKQHNVFLGWFTDSACSSPAATQYSVTANTTLYAGWKVVEYTVMFEVDGGTSITPVKVEYGKTLSLNTYRTERNYYTFNGWYSDSERTNKITEITILGDTSVYAGWTIKSFTVYFETNGGSVIDPKTVSAGSKLNLNDIITTKTNYEFTGWFKESSCITKISNITVTENTTIYAGWKLNTYTVTFEVNGGTSFDPITEPFGTIIDLTSYIPTKNNYDFIGWYKDVGCTVAVSNNYIIKENATLYAGWQALFYNVVLNKQEGSGGTDNVTLYYGQTLPTIKTPTRDRYFFDGYFTQTNGNGIKFYNEDGTPAINSLQIKDVSTLYACWTEAIAINITVKNMGAITVFSGGTEILHVNGFANTQGGTETGTILVKKGQPVNLSFYIETYHEVGPLETFCDQFNAFGLGAGTVVVLQTSFYSYYQGCDDPIGLYDENNKTLTCSTLTQNITLCFNFSTLDMETLVLGPA